MMKEQKQPNISRLAATMTVALIMICIPVSSVLVIMLYSFFRNLEKAAEPGIAISSDIVIQSGIPIEIFFVIVTVMFVMGLGILAYVGYKGFRQRRNGKESL